MNHPPPPPPPPPKKEVQLQGPRPSPLRVNKESVKIKKPPPHPLLDGLHQHQHEQQQQPQPQQQQQQQPVVIYTVSPKVIHATVSEFMSLVQRLTGPSSSLSSSADGGLSPAARLASIHKTSPKYSSTTSNNNTTTISLDDEGLMETIINNFQDRGGGGSIQLQLDEIGQFPSILSPAPATLPPIPSGFFSPALSHQLDVLNWGHGIGNNNNSFNFTASPSPSALFSAPLVSPSPSSWDLFNNFLDHF